MKLEILPYFLEFKRPFALAHGTRSGTHLAFIKLDFQGITAYGETSLPPYRKETFESVKAWIGKQQEKIEFLIEKDVWKYQNEIPFSKENPSASAAVQTALWNFHYQKTGKKITELFQIPTSSPSLTLTVTKNDYDFIDEKFALEKHFTHFKIKLTGSADDFDFVKALRSKTDIPFCIDFNQGYSKKEEALRLIEKLEKLNSVLMEQPLKEFDHEGHFWIKQRSSTPVIADESICLEEDLKQFYEAYSGVNVKLMKCGGLIQAKRMIEFASEKKMLKLIGCMSESSLGISMAANLAPLCDMADLDAPYLNKNDPFTGFEIVNGKLTVGELKQKEIF